jgi:uncharacterized protein YciI
MKHVSAILITILLFASCIGRAQEDAYFFVFLNTNPDKELLPEDSVQVLQKGHQENIGRLYEAGQLVVAGPFEGGGGIFIFKTPSLEETERLLNTDPAIKAGRFKLEVYPFEQYYGSICDVGDEYEMKYRLFLRFRSTTDSKAEPREIHQMLESAFSSFTVEEPGKIMAGNFGGIPEGIWILGSGESEPVVEYLENLRKFEEVGITFEIKTLWIAEGVFCEE